MTEGKVLKRIPCQKFKNPIYLTEVYWILLRIGGKE